LTLRASHLVSVTGLATVSTEEFGRIPGMFSPTPTFVDRRESLLPHRVSVNALGYRGAAFPRQKPPGEFRILHLGDSFTFGDFVNDDETLPAQIEAQLRRTCPSVRVINAGLPGSTITEQREILSRARDVSPDMVLLSFTENDVTDLSTVPMWEQLRVNREQKSGFPLGIVYPILRHTALWNLAMKLRGRLHEQARTSRTEETGTIGVVPNPVLRTRYAAVFGAMAGSLQHDGTPFLFTLFPAHQTLYKRWSTEQLDGATGMANSAGIPVISTTDALRADGRDERQLYLMPIDGHPSATGYAVAATEISRALLAQQALATHCAVGHE
jgi:lysophospholipase L1-like esterase